MLSSMKRSKFERQNGHFKTGLDCLVIGPADSNHARRQFCPRFEISLYDQCFRIVYVESDVTGFLLPETE